MRLTAKDKILGQCLDELNISDLDLQKGTDLLLMHMCIKGERERERFTKSKSSYAICNILVSKFHNQRALFLLCGNYADIVEQPCILGHKDVLVHSCIDRNFVKHTLQITPSQISLYDVGNG